MRFSDSTITSAVRSALAGAVLCISLATPIAAEAKDKEKFSVILDWTPYQPHHYAFWLAKEKGWYEEAGLDVDITNVMGSNAVIQALVGGQGDIGLAGTAVFSKAVADLEVPLKTVAVFHQKDVLSLRYLESSGITEPKDLAGKTVGVVTGSMAQVLWPAFLGVVDVDPATVQLVGTDWATYNSALVSGAIQATNSSVGLVENITLAAEGKPVGEFMFADYLPLMGHGLVVSDAVIAERGKAVEAFVKATQKAWDYLEADPDAALQEAAAIIQTTVEKAPSEALLIETGKMVIPALMRQPSTAGKPLGWSSAEDWNKMTAVLVDAKFMSHAPAVEELVTNAFVD